MRTLFIETEEIENKQEELECTLEEALDALAPWACKIIEVEGGYHAFESITDYNTWINQI